MLTRNGMYDGTFFNRRTTNIEVTTYNDPDDAKQGPQYMIFTFMYSSDSGNQKTIIVNYDDYINAFTFNIDYSNERNPKYLVMPRTIKYGIGRFYEDEHTNFRFGEDDTKRFSLITFTWSDQ